MFQQYGMNPRSALLWQVRHSDAIFGPLLTEAQHQYNCGPARFALMVGDQIYADMMSRHVPIGLSDTFEEFQERYHSAFSSPYMRRLLRNLPTYMILDDHEIEDNWTQDRISKSYKRRLFHLAINAYMSYQWVHGPRNFGKRLFYDFHCGGYPFFVLDTRTQRYMDDIAESLDDNHLLGRPSLDRNEPSQLDLLIQWLHNCQCSLGNKPKFVVSSSVFVPNPMSAREGRDAPSFQCEVRWKERSDSWPAFPQTRRALLSAIIRNKIQNVVFVSGDIHCSNVAAMRFSGSEAAEKLRAFSITSSALYWPFPFADGEPSSFVHDSANQLQKDTFAIDELHSMDYKAWNFTQEDNFCRVDIDHTTFRIVVRPFNTAGELVRSGHWFGADGTELISELQLVDW